MGSLCTGGFTQTEINELLPDQRPGAARTRARKEKQEEEFNAGRSSMMGTFTSDGEGEENTYKPKSLQQQLSDVAKVNSETKLALERSEAGLRYTLDYIDALKGEIQAAGLDIGEFERNIKAKLEKTTPAIPDQDVQTDDRQPLTETV